MHVLHAEFLDMLSVVFAAPTHFFSLLAGVCVICRTPCVAFACVHRRPFLNVRTRSTTSALYLKIFRLPVGDGGVWQHPTYRQMLRVIELAVSFHWLLSLRFSRNWFSLLFLLYMTAWTLICRLSSCSGPVHRKSLLRRGRHEWLRSWELLNSQYGASSLRYGLREWWDQN